MSLAPPYRAMRKGHPMPHQSGKPVVRPQPELDAEYLGARGVAALVNELYRCLDGIFHPQWPAAMRSWSTT